jgi:hypothetical protein
MQFFSDMISQVTTTSAIISDGVDGQTVLARAMVVATLSVPELNRFLRRQIARFGLAVLLGTELHFICYLRIPRLIGVVART